MQENSEIKDQVEVIEKKPRKKREVKVKDESEKVVKEPKPKMPKKIPLQTEQENLDWISMCEYVKKEILGYPEEMKFPKELALKLKGLSEGKFIATKKIDTGVKYSYRCLYFTAIDSRQKILDYFRNNSVKIKDESHRINLVMLFMEKNINNIYLRMQSAKTIESKIENVEVRVDNVGASYTKKSKEVSDKLKDLF